MHPTSLFSWGTRRTIPSYKKDLPNQNTQDIFPNTFLLPEDIYFICLWTFLYWKLGKQQSVVHSARWARLAFYLLFLYPLMHMTLPAQSSINHLTWLEMYIFTQYSSFILKDEASLLWLCLHLCADSLSLLNNSLSDFVIHLSSDLCIRWEGLKARDYWPGSSSCCWAWRHSYLE